MKIDRCDTSFGSFNVKKSESSIAVGGTKICVNINIFNNDGELYWLGTKDGGCELHGSTIKGDNTIKMTDLAFTIVKLYKPHVKTIRLIDDSGFTWRESNGRPYKVNFLKGYLLLHQNTWYEEKFGAIMQNHDEYSLYLKRKQNFYDPLKKPKVFNFNNDEVRKILEPIYNETNTWKEFIDKFIKLHDSDKYKLMYDWYRNAIYTIFDNHDIDQYWEIDISKRPNITCNCNATNKKGGQRKSIKNRNKIFDKYIRFETHTHIPIQ